MSSNTTKVSEQNVPNDLRERYERLQKQARGSKAQRRYAASQLCFIERIAKLEAQVEALKHKYDDSFDQLGVKSLAELVDRYEAKIEALSMQEGDRE